MSFHDLADLAGDEVRRLFRYAVKRELSRAANFDEDVVQHVTRTVEHVLEGFFHKLDDYIDYSVDATRKLSAPGNESQVAAGDLEDRVIQRQLQRAIEHARELSDKVEQAEKRDARLQSQFRDLRRQYYREIHRLKQQRSFLQMKLVECPDFTDEDLSKYDDDITFFSVVEFLDPDVVELLQTKAQELTARHQITEQMMQRQIARLKMQLDRQQRDNMTLEDEAVALRSKLKLLLPVDTPLETTTPATSTALLQRAATAAQTAVEYIAQGHGNYTDLYTPEDPPGRLQQLQAAYGAGMTTLKELRKLCDSFHQQLRDQGDSSMAMSLNTNFSDIQLRIEQFDNTFATIAGNPNSYKRNHDLNNQLLEMQEQCEVLQSKVCALLVDKASLQKLLQDEKSDPQKANRKLKEMTETVENQDRTIMMCDLKISSLKEENGIIKGELDAVKRTLARANDMLLAMGVSMEESGDLETGRKEEPGKEAQTEESGEKDKDTGTSHGEAENNDGTGHHTHSESAKRTDQTTGNNVEDGGQDSACDPSRALLSVRNRSFSKSSRSVWAAGHAPSRSSTLSSRKDSLSNFSKRPPKLKASDDDIVEQRRRMSSKLATLFQDDMALVADAVEARNDAESLAEILVSNMNTPGTISKLMHQRLLNLAISRERSRWQKLLPRTHSVDALPGCGWPIAPPKPDLHIIATLETVLSTVEREADATRKSALFEIAGAGRLTGTKTFVPPELNKVHLRILQLARDLRKSFEDQLNKTRGALYTADRRSLEVYTLQKKYEDLMVESRTAWELQRQCLSSCKEALQDSGLGHVLQVHSSLLSNNPSDALRIVELDIKKGCVHSSIQALQRVKARARQAARIQIGALRSCAAEEAGTLVAHQDDLTFACFEECFRRHSPQDTKLTIVPWNAQTQRLEQLRQTWSEQYKVMKEDQNMAGADPGGAQVALGQIEEVSHVSNMNAAMENNEDGADSVCGEMLWCSYYVKREIQIDVSHMPMTTRTTSRQSMDSDNRIDEVPLRQETVRNTSSVHSSSGARKAFQPMASAGNANKIAVNFTTPDLDDTVGQGLDACHRQLSAGNETKSVASSKVSFIEDEIDQNADIKVINLQDDEPILPTLPPHEEVVDDWSWTLPGIFLQKPDLRPVREYRCPALTSDLDFKAIQKEEVTQARNASKRDRKLRQAPISIIKQHDHPTISMLAWTPPSSPPPSDGGSSSSSGEDCANSQSSSAQSSCSANSRLSQLPMSHRGSYRQSTSPSPRQQQLSRPHVTCTDVGVQMPEFILGRLKEQSVQTETEGIPVERHEISRRMHLRRETIQALKQHQRPVVSQLCATVDQGRSMAATDPILASHHRAIPETCRDTGDSSSTTLLNLGVTTQDDLEGSHSTTVGESIFSPVSQIRKHFQTSAISPSFPRVSNAQIGCTSGGQQNSSLYEKRATEKSERGHKEDEAVNINGLKSVLQILSAVSLRRSTCTLPSVISPGTITPKQAAGVGTPDAFEANNNIGGGVWLRSDPEERLPTLHSYKQQRSTRKRRVEDARESAVFLINATDDLQGSSGGLLDEDGMQNMPEDGGREESNPGYHVLQRGAVKGGITNDNKTSNADVAFVPAPLHIENQAQATDDQDGSIDEAEGDENSSDEGLEDSELINLLGDVCAEVVDVSQQTDFQWETLPYRLMTWIQLNLMQRQQALMYCSSWSASELDDFTMSLEDREKILKGFETFLFNVMCLTRPARAVNQRRALRQHYRQNFLDQLSGGAPHKIFQSPVPEEVEVQPLKPDELPLHISTSSSLRISTCVDLAACKSGSSLPADASTFLAPDASLPMLGSMSYVSLDTSAAMSSREPAEVLQAPREHDRQCTTPFKRATPTLRMPVVDPVTVNAACAAAATATAGTAAGTAAAAAAAATAAAAAASAAAAAAATSAAGATGSAEATAADYSTDPAFPTSNLEAIKVSGIAFGFQGQASLGNSAESTCSADPAASARELNSLLGFDLSKAKLDGVQQDVYCVSYAIDRLPMQFRCPNTAKHTQSAHTAVVRDSIDESLTAQNGQRVEEVPRHGFTSETRVQCLPMRTSGDQCKEVMSFPSMPATLQRRCKGLWRASQPKQAASQTDWEKFQLLAQRFAALRRYHRGPIPRSIKDHLVRLEKVDLELSTQFSSLIGEKEEHRDQVMQCIGPLLRHIRAAVDAQDIDASELAQNIGQGCDAEKLARINSAIVELTAQAKKRHIATRALLRFAFHMLQDNKCKAAETNFLQGVQGSQILCSDLPIPRNCEQKRCNALGDNARPQTQETRLSCHSSREGLCGGGPHDGFIGAVAWSYGAPASGNRVLIPPSPSPDVRPRQHDLKTQLQAETLRRSPSREYLDLADRGGSFSCSLPAAGSAFQACRIERPGTAPECAPHRDVSTSHRTSSCRSQRSCTSHALQVEEDHKERRATTSTQKQNSSSLGVGLVVEGLEIPHRAASAQSEAEVANQGTPQSARRPMRPLVVSEPDPTRGVRRQPTAEEVPTVVHAAAAPLQVGTLMQTQALSPAADTTMTASVFAKALGRKMAAFGASRKPSPAGSHGPRVRH